MFTIPLPEGGNGARKSNKFKFENKILIQEQIKCKIKKIRFKIAFDFQLGLTRKKQ